MHQHNSKSASEIGHVNKPLLGGFEAVGLFCKAAGCESINSLMVRLHNGKNQIKLVCFREEKKKYFLQVKPANLAEILM
jgi:hypothetical protein